MTIAAATGVPAMRHARLARLAPKALEITDDSALHVGHEGAAGGGGSAGSGGGAGGALVDREHGRHGWKLPRPPRGGNPPAFDPSRSRP